MKRLFIKDSSTFGTFVNGNPLEKEQWTMLQENDVVGLRNPHGSETGLVAGLPVIRIMDSKLPLDRS